MEMICLKSTIMQNINGENVEIEVVRYFINNETEYLIYSLNEIDSAGYTKLYASKIIGNKASIISDEEEWNLVKEIIKQVVKCNRDGSPLEIIDLNENNLNDIILNDTRVFKLQGNLVNLLSENKKVKEEIIQEPVTEEIDDDFQEFTQPTIEPLLETIEEEPIDYEQMYNDLLVENQTLKQEIESLKELQGKIDKIKEILD